MRRWTIVGGLVVVLAAGVWLLTRRRGHEKARYETAQVERGDVVEGVTATGTLQARVTVQVGSQVSGTIAALGADYNDAVKKDHVLARIDPALFEAEVQQARATLALAQADVEKSRAAEAQAHANWERARDLAGKGFESPQNLDQLRLALETAQAEKSAAAARVEQARAALDRARVSLERTVIASPIDGVVISRSVDVGQTVAASLQAPTLFTLAADLRQMEVQVNVDEADVGKLRDGQDGRFSVDAFPGVEFRGRLRQIRNASITLQNVVTYVAVFDVDNPDLRLRPGMTTNVTIETARKKDVVKVPNAALRFRPPEADGAGFARGRMPAGEGKLWKLVAGEPRPVVVKLGITDGTATEVISGAQPGEEFVTGSSDGKKKAPPTGMGRRPF